MNRTEFEEKCIAAKLKDYQFCSIEEIEEVLEIDIKATEGYTRLSKDDKEAYKNFTVNYINSVGIANKVAFKPVLVYRCIQKNTSINDYRIAEEYIRKTNGAVVDSWNDDSEVETGEKIITETEYLRVNYESVENEEWLHITANGEEWY